MRKLLFILLMLYGTVAKAQYPFEKYPAVKYKACNDWKTLDRLEEKEKQVTSTLSIPAFFDNTDTLTIALTSFADHCQDHSLVRLFHNQREIRQTTEDIFFNPIALDTVRVADINGDGLQDAKIIFPYMGNGLASLNTRVIYLFQDPDHSLRLISYDDKMGPHQTERDVDGDGNYEIITMSLLGYQNHNYWLFNLFEYVHHELISANQKADYPIMIQYLHRENFEITNKISRSKMKQFGMSKPPNGCGTL